MFLLVAEGLSRALKDAKRQGSLKGIQVAPNMFITHLIFVDDVLIFYSGSVRYVNTIGEILDLFSKATGMEVNADKSTITTHRLREEERLEFLRIFPYNCDGLDDGLKYTGFHLKPNSYKKQD